MRRVWPSAITGVIAMLQTAVAVADENVKPEPELRLAVVAPVTGSWSGYGTEIVEGVQLAAGELQSEGTPLRLVIEDACLPADTVRAAHKLVELDRVQAVVGSYCVVGMVPMVPILEKKGVFAFHTSAVPDAILDAGDLAFTTNVTIGDEAKALAEYAYRTLGARKAGVLYLLTQWGQDYHRYFTEHFIALGGKIAAVFENPIGTNDFRSEALRIKAAAPDVVFVAHVGAELSTALKQLREQGITSPRLGAHEAEEQGVLDAAGPAAEGLMFLSPELSNTEAAAAFRAAYQKRFNRQPGILAANAYDATRLVTDALRACRRDVACARDRIYAVRDYPGMSGRFSMTERGGTVKKFIRKEVRGGRFAASEGR